MPTGCLFRRKVSVLLVLLGSLLAMGEAAPAADFYVSPSGKDEWSGRAAAPDGQSGGPFATLQKARDAIRQLKASAGLPEGGVTVWIAPGTYPLDKALELTAEDSGEAGKPIVYRAATETQVRVTGGDRKSVV